MRLMASAAALVLTVGATVSPLLAGGDVRVIVAQRTLEDIDFDDENQTSFGVDVRFGGDGWPVRIVAGATRVHANDGWVGTGIYGNVTEMFAGVVKEWGSGAARPFLGAGVSEVITDLEHDDRPSHGTSEGAYVHTGVCWKVGGGLLVGVEMRGLFGTNVDVAGFSTEVDYVQIGAVLGWGWGRRSP